MPTVLCLCNECGDHYYSKDLYGPVAKNLFKSIKKDKVPSTWDEWVIHISTHCEKCRLQNIPTKCLEDYEKLKTK